MADEDKRKPGGGATEGAGGSAPDSAEDSTSAQGQGAAFWEALEENSPYTALEKGLRRPAGQRIGKTRR